jgi:acyl carrier protein
VSDVSPLEAEVATLIVRTLTLQVDPAQIRPEEPLFGGGLGLDSIDALESLRSLCQSIKNYRTK